VNFDKRIDRQSTQALKWDIYKGQDVLPMWVADMDFQSPQPVLDALRERTEHGVFGYTLPPQELVELVVQPMADLCQWKIQPEWLVWLPGLVCGLNVTARAIGKPGDEIMTNVPVYPPFLSAPKNQDKVLKTFPVLKNKERWEFDFDAFEQAISANTKMFILCNPHNPLGRIFSHAELSRMAELCEKHNIIICSDEIHCDLLLDEDKKHIPTATLSPEIADRTITLMAPSKTFNIPGLGLSFAIIPNAKIRASFTRAQMGIVPHPNVFSYTGAVAAYQHGQPWLDELLRYLAENRDLVEHKINDLPGLSTTHVEATYLAWIDTRELGQRDAYQFFKDHGVGLSNGKDFGGDGFVRLNFGCPRSILDEALQRMEKAVMSL